MKRNVPIKKYPLSIQKSVYALTSKDGESAELTMYGDIYEQRPVDSWTGKPVEGNFILLNEFLQDLDAVAGCKRLTIRMNSYGGDAGVSITIHNRLRELARDGMKLTCIVDGVAMSGGSLIMCACDTVKVNPSSLVMIHKCVSLLWGYYNADDMREAAESNDAYDKAQIKIYERKTGLASTVISHMMSDCTYMTGREAVVKGFADEVLEDAEPLNIAASADGRSLFVRGKQISLVPGVFSPDRIPQTASGNSTVKPSCYPISSEAAVCAACTGKAKVKEEPAKTPKSCLEEARAEVRALLGDESEKAPEVRLEKARAIVRALFGHAD